MNNFWKSWRMWAVLPLAMGSLSIGLPRWTRHSPELPPIPKTRLQQVSAFTTPPLAAAAVPSYEILSFRTLRLYLPGKKPPAEVIAWNGKNVEIMGFMSALTQLEDITEFVLASSPPMNCFCHPPLRVNEVIFVQMNKGKKTDYKGGVVKIRGRLEVNTNVQDEFADIMYTVYCDEVL